MDMVIKDSQPFTLVEDEGFRGFVNKLDPTCVLPTRQVFSMSLLITYTKYLTKAFIQHMLLFFQALKAMVEAKFQKAKEEAKARVANSSAVSLTADMWSSINMDACLAITCHFIDDSQALNTVPLGVQKFPQAHAAANMTAAKANMMEEWGITRKVTCLVTDAVAKEAKSKTH